MPPKQKKAAKAIKVRRGLTTKPKVEGHIDYKADGLVRVLYRAKDLFPEFALYPNKRSRHAGVLLRSLSDGGLKEEEKGKWVLRTNKFSIFVYV